MEAIWVTGSAEPRWGRIAAFQCLGLAASAAFLAGAVVLALPARGHPAENAITVARVIVPQLSASSVYRLLTRPRRKAPSHTRKHR